MIPHMTLIRLTANILQWETPIELFLDNLLESDTGRGRMLH